MHRAGARDLAHVKKEDENKSKLQTKDFCHAWHVRDRTGLRGKGKGRKEGARKRSGREGKEKGRTEEEWKRKEGRKVGTECLEQHDCNSQRQSSSSGEWSR